MSIKHKNKTISHTWDSIYCLLFSILIFLIPSNLFLKFGESSAYVNGMFVDYLLLKFYLSDVIIFIILGLSGWEIIHHKQVSGKIKSWVINNKWLLVFSLLLLVRQLVTVNLISIWGAIKTLEMLFLAQVLIQKKQLLINKMVISSLQLTLIFQSLLSFYQAYFQKHFLGFIFLGEPILTSPIGLAKTTIAGVERILPYGTTAHPNILAGVIGIYLFFLLQLIKIEKIKPSLPTLVTLMLPLATLWLTRSISAWLSLGIMVWLVFFGQRFKNFLNTHLNILMLSLIFVIFFIPVLIHLGLPLQPNNLSLSRREILNQAGLMMIFDHPVLGVGLNNFVVNLEQYAITKEVVRFLQPVHNVGLLVVSQTGILGMIWLIVLWKKLPKQIKVSLCLGGLILLPILSLDHYLLTIQTGMLLLVFTIGIIRATNQLVQERGVKRSI